MTATHDSGEVRTSRWLHALRRTRFVLAAAAIVFASLWALGAIAVAPALVGFALIAAAVMVASAGAEAMPAALPRNEPPAARIGDPLIEAVLAGLPDPVVALDHRGEVVALNARAAAVAPALRRGEPVSLGLRVPEVLEAIRRAHASGTCATRRVLRARAARPLVRSHRDADLVGGTHAPAGPPAAGIPRSHAAAARRGDARRLRRQCEP